MIPRKNIKRRTLCKSPQQLTLAQPPPIPPRINVREDGYHGPGSTYGWNLSGMSSNRQPPIARLSQEQEAQMRFSSPMNYFEQLVVNMPEPKNTRPLISLDSPRVENRNPPLNKTYSSELEGIDFTSSDSQNLKDGKVYSSSLEDLSSGSNVYPNIRHMFSDVQPLWVPEQNYSPLVPIKEQAISAPHSKYGQNPYVFGYQTGTVYSVHNGASSASIPPLSSALFMPGVYAPVAPPAGRNPFIGHANRPESFSGVQAINMSANWSLNSLHRPASCSDLDDLDIENGKHLMDSEKDNQSASESDLIELKDDICMEDEYMSLEYFDPLYAKSRRDSVSHAHEVVPHYSFASPMKDSAPANGESFSSGSWITFSSPAKGENVTELYPDLNLSESLDRDTEPVERHNSSVHENDTYYDFHDVEDMDKFHRAEEDNQQLFRTKSGKSTEQPSKPPPPEWRTTKISDYEPLRQRMFIDPESVSFCQMVAELKSNNKSTNEETNLGFMISPMCDIQLDSMSVKVVIHSEFATEPIPFTCDIHSKVEHVISHVLYSCLGEANVTQSLSVVDYILKVYDRSEYLLNDVLLSQYDYIHHCLKLDLDIMFQLMHRQDISLPFIRTIDDDVQYLYFPKDYIKIDETPVTRDKLDILMETFYGEIEKLRNRILQGESALIQFSGLNQSVKAICNILVKIETIDITTMLQRSQHIVGKLMSRKSPGSGLGESGGYEDPVTVQALDIAVKCSLIEELEEVLEQLLISVKQLVRMFCHTFHVDFLLGSSMEKMNDSQDLHFVEDSFLVHIATCHRIPVDWKGKYDEYKVVCSLHHGKKTLSEDKATSCAALSNTGLCDRILWDEWLSFESVNLCILPRETRLCLTLCGLRNVPNTANTSNESLKVTTALGGVTVQLFSQKGFLLQGSQMVPLKMNSKADPYSPVCSVLQADSALLQFNLPEFGKQIVFPPVLSFGGSKRKSFDILLPEIKDIINGMMQKDTLSSCEADDLDLLWSYRHYLYSYPHMLPWLLQAAHSWDWACLADTYLLLKDWQTLEPMQSLELLLPQFPDIEVRKFAVGCLRKMPTDVLIDFIPQLIQALKYESYHNSALAELLLEQSCRNVRFAHHFFWLLKGAAQDMMYKRRYELMFVALVSVAGDALYQAFRKQEELMKALNNTAEKVKLGKESLKDTVLRSELQTVYELFEEKGCILLPFNPGSEVTGIDLKSCSYFTSNAFPLKLVFKNSNVKADPVYAMVKVGDDLRQDMLTMQMIRIMDRLWLKQGLDLKIITFSCLPTGPRRGIIELVTESETLRKIQVSSGVTGSFNDRGIKDWLQKHNPTELEYQKAIENFTCSCAGYCVATYVLGICDRHNDNIMLKETGHMFHIDFNKFLGDAQMFGNIKRDRVAFVLTSDMAHVINDGGRPGDRFQRFVDLCCQAFNILRKNANLFISLFSLMSRSGIPGLSDISPQFIQKVLFTSLSDAQAAASFTRMIEDSLKSVFTQFNFFLHNLAQRKFSSHTEGALLSFVPKTYSMDTDGKIKKVEVHGYQKRYSPEKQYIFILRIERVNQKVPMYIFRLFHEFVEFRTKLVNMFPLVSWPPLPSRVILGRSQVQSVAENRKIEIEKFLKDLWTKAAEISQSDLVYTFFHPLLRDEQDVQKDQLNLTKLRENFIQPVRQRNRYGMVKLSVEYQKEKLQIMIMHAKDLLATSSEHPSPYVKTYLLPDPEKQTKRKTKVVKSSTHPTYNEVIEYKVFSNEIHYKTLQVTVWDHDILKENSLLGALYIKLRDLDLTKPEAKWYTLEKLQITNSNMLA